MYTRIEAAGYTLEGISLGGIHTSLHVPEMDVLLDVGLPIRQFTPIDRVFLSHVHGDHAGGLGSFLGLRTLLHRKPPPTLYCPAEAEPKLREMIDTVGEMQNHPFDVALRPMAPNDEEQLRTDLWVRALRSDHTLPCRAYLFFDRVERLRAEYRDLSGREIAARRERGEAMLEPAERLELAYCTDTRIEIFDEYPELYRTKVLVVEATFLDDTRSTDEVRARGHIHLDEILARADRFENEVVVIMHASRFYAPLDAHRILRERCQGRLRPRVLAFAPFRRDWGV